MHRTRSPLPPAAAREGDGLVVRADAGERERRAVEDGPAFATSIDVSRHAVHTAGIAGALLEAPGTHPRQSGDALAPAAVTLRGAPAQQVTIALDGIVLNDAYGEGVDISVVPIALLDRVDVYRGVAPMRLGVSGFGGAIELRTRARLARSFTHVSLGVGTQWQRRALAVASGGGALHRALIAVGYRGTDGDFSYYDDRGTELNPADDVVAPRRNNAAHSFDLLARYCGGPVRAEFCAMVLGVQRARGMPGPASVSYSQAHVSQARWIARLSHRTLVGAGERVASLETWLAVSHRFERFRDPAAEVVAGREIDVPSAGLSVEAGLLSRAPSVLGTFEPVLRARYENALGASVFDASARGHRWSGMAGIELSGSRGPVDYRASGGFEALLDRGDAPGTLATLLPAARLAVRTRIAPFFDARATYSHSVRAPSLIERFGIGGVVLPNETLRPEHGDGGDIGIVAHTLARSPTHSQPVTARFEAVAFARHARDLIVLVRTDPIALKAFNLRAALFAGGEFSFRASIGRWFSATVAYTLTHAATLAPGSPTDARRPPNTAAHDLFIRLEATELPVRPWASTTFTSGVYFDELNARAAPPNLRVDLGVRLVMPFARWLALDAYVSNLFDMRHATVSVFRGGQRTDIVQPIADFAGFPLPGRVAFVQLSVESERMP